MTPFKVNKTQSVFFFGAEKGKTILEFFKMSRKISAYVLEFILGVPKRFQHTPSVLIGLNPEVTYP